MEKTDWVADYLLEKPGAVKDFKVEWQWLRFLVGGKMFAALLHPSEKYDPMYAGKDLMNLKCDPLFSELLREKHPEIMPGFYSDKRTSISVDINGNLPRELLCQLMDESYRLTFTKLTKKLQQEVLETAEKKGDSLEIDS